MVQAAASAILGAFGSQGKREPGSRDPLPSAVNAVIAAPDLKRAKLAKKTAQQERLLSVLTQPEVLAMVLTFAGVIAANKIPFSSNEAENNLLQGIMTTTSVVMGCGYAGVGDLTSLSLGISAGGASILSGLIGDVLDDTGGSLNPFKWKWPLGPIWNW